MKRLSEDEYHATFGEKMTQVVDDTPPPFDFWDYVETIPEEDFDGHDCSDGSVSYVWSDSSGQFQHVLVNSEDKNVFMVIVLDLLERRVYGHRLLNLNKEYGLEPV